MIDRPLVRNGVHFTAVSAAIQNPQKNPLRNLTEPHKSRDLLKPDDPLFPSSFVLVPAFGAFCGFASPLSS